MRFDIGRLVHGGRTRHDATNAVAGTIQKLQANVGRVFEIVIANGRDAVVGFQLVHAGKGTFGGVTVHHVRVVRGVGLQLHDIHLTETQTGNPIVVVGGAVNDSLLKAVVKAQLGF